MPPDRLSLLKCHDRIRPKTRRSIKKVDTGYKKIETTYKRRAFLLCYLTAFFAAANDENDTGQKSVWKTQKRLIIWGVLWFFTCLCRRMCLTHTHVPHWSKQQRKASVVHSKSQWNLYWKIVNLKQAWRTYFRQLQFLVLPNLEFLGFSSVLQKVDQFLW